MFEPSQDILIYFPFSNSSFALISGLSLFSCLKSNDFFKTNLHDFYKWLLLFHTHCLNPSSSVLYFFYFDYGFSPFDCGGSGGNLFFSYHFYFILFFGMEIWNGKQISMVNLLNYFSPLFLNFCAFASLLSCIDFVSSSINSFSNK